MMEGGAGGLTFGDGGWAGAERLNPYCIRPANGETMDGQASRGGRSLVVGGGAPGAPACTKSGAVKERTMETVHRSFLFVALGVVGRTVLASPGADLTPAERDACRVDIVSLEGARASRGGHPEVRDALIASGERDVAACVARERQQEVDRRKFDAIVEDQRARQDAERRAAREDAAERAKKENSERLERERVSLIIENGRSDRGIQQVVQSWNLCAGQAARKEALDGIAEEKRYAKKAGVTNLGKLESLKGDLMEADQDIAGAKQVLAAVKAKPLGCSDARISLLIDCLNTQSDPASAPPACVKDSMVVSMALARGN